MSDQPLVSIVIPVYNGVNYLREAIDSALAQTYPHCEVLVVNDGSTDGGATEAIALSYGDRIRYVCKENGGVASALNLGIREMRGEYFSWLSHDDVYYPDKVAVQIEAALKLDGPMITYSDFDVIDANSRVLYRHQIKEETASDVVWGLLTRSSVNGCTTLIPKECFEKVGVFDELLRTTQDFDLWIRLARHFKFIHISRALIKSRLHASQGSQTISGHHHSANEFFICTLDGLSREYIASSLEKHGPAFFIKIAYHLRRRGFTEAADHARQLACARQGTSLLSLCWVALDEVICVFFRLNFIRRSAKAVNRRLKLVD